MKHISLQINVEVPDDYEFEDGYELMEYVNRWDLDYQIMWTKELEKGE